MSFRINAIEYLIGGMSLNGQSIPAFGVNKGNTLAKGGAELFSMKLNSLILKDKRLFDKYLSKPEHFLSTYTFENIYIWKGLFRIYWVVFKNHLCVFFQDNMGCFLYLSPQGERQNPEVIRYVFAIMDKFNQNKNVSRIENVEESEVSFYKSLGYECRLKPGEYLCERKDLVSLQGNIFKSKRSACNFFLKNYPYKYLPFFIRYKDDCLKLYGLWAKERLLKERDEIYKGMLSDSYKTLKVLLENFKNLGIIGRVVKIGDKIKAFTFGFEVNRQTFCILYEITDLNFNGLAQFIFREFCRELVAYKYINIMDDSGLENLKAVKLSYHPLKIVPSYIVTRVNA